MAVNIKDLSVGDIVKIEGIHLLRYTMYHVANIYNAEKVPEIIQPHGNSFFKKLMTKKYNFKK